MMTRMKKYSMAISAAALAISGVAFAQGNEKHRGFDADGDGVVTRAEAQTAATTAFTKLDANKDGKIDKSDREALRAERLDKKFEILDADKNGSISKQEFTAKRDRDGKRGQRDQAGVDSEKGESQRKHRGHHRGGGMMMHKMADANKDGAISQAEFTAAATKHFDMVDTNKDGRITKEEREAAHQKMKEAWKAKKAQTSTTAK
jgi:hypothetical protein